MKIISSSLFITCSALMCFASNQPAEIINEHPTPRTNQTLASTPDIISAVSDVEQKRTEALKRAKRKLRLEDKDQKIPDKK